jgi:hypothetical protein
MNSVGTRALLCFNGNMLFEFTPTLKVSLLEKLNSLRSWRAFLFENFVFTNDLVLFRKAVFELSRPIQH